MSHTKLFIPGPVEVSAKTMAAFSKPMIGHRSKDFQNLYASIQPGLQKLFMTRQPVFVSTSSAWGVMEGAIRNLVAKKVLTCMNGAFSDKWYDVALKAGKQAEKLQVEWGQPIRGAAIEEKLKTGEFDAVTLIHNETSTGTMSPIEEIAEVARRYPDVSFIVDVVSSLSVLPIDFDALGFDVLLAGTQKALALPSGASVFSVSERAFAKAEKQKDRGYYIDFLEFRKNHESSMTPTTPSIAHFYALQSKLEDMEAEGVEARHARHLKNATITRAWAKNHGFELFPDAGYESIGLTCVRNVRNVDIAKVISHLKANHHAVIDGGYGKIKGTTFRISHMGDESTANIEQLLGWLDEGLKSL
ncbi:aspartate aminotransferase [Verrucomicrobium sp. GAS474]|uniref:pyridoxal-phosphate-dependent aminotransferase family protein n=1 Tax=Verrucomicrobium sp. GAS474 TaxID=1882831 RepID=UPI00087BE964|nr:alanine--glyoxylate aminotransferase family protein [Verrucomicrobium sp. GAS474]SDU10559.1 aspartate aminotransferase [Verrucomicrobium sp. GAS474]